MFPRKLGSAWTIQAPAKLNLYLEVLGPRADGFHALETLMMPVRVYDQLSYRLKPGSPLKLRVRNLLPREQIAKDLGPEDDNLVLRAARLLAANAKVVPSGQFDLVKRIPVQAGMGGGSSDAAAALLLANEAWSLGYSRQQLMPLAAELGSDVPFFLGTGSAICRGRGEIIDAVDRLPRMHFVIAKPPTGFSTAEIFRQLPATPDTAERRAASSRDALANLIDSLQRGALAEAGRVMTNRLEFAVERLAPWLVRFRELFSRSGCLAQFMTGSGSAYVGVMRSARHAQVTARRMNGLNSDSGTRLGHVLVTASC